MKSFRVDRLSGMRDRAVIHVPHASAFIPNDERLDIVLDDDGLLAELVAMTDWYTDRLAARAASAGVTRVINHLSRLVVDPERFADATELMNAVGMGAVYHRTSTGKVLRRDDPMLDQRLIDTWFRPYEAAMADAVGSVLHQTDRCLIVDLHSYPADPLPYETDLGAPRPGVCLGTDPVHTPPELLDLAVELFADVPGGVGENTPFAGTYVPQRYYRSDPRVTSIMIEIRRDLYLEPPRTYLDAPADDLARRISDLIDRWTLPGEGTRPR